MNNRLHNANNPYQGDTKKVLCVCSAGLLRSPTAAVVLASEPYNYNTRAVGLDSSFALIPIDNILVHWADEIVCMTIDQQYTIQQQMKIGNWETRPVKCLYISDSYSYRNPDLIQLIKNNYKDNT